MPEPLTIPRENPVLVTGATGYVAGRVVERLLQEGLTVHATVRDPSKTDRLTYLNELADAHPGEIRFFGADLLKPGSFAEAMEGCSVVFHLASPFTNRVDDPQKELIDPAVHGTANVLEQANAVASVQRVVVTSSCAAIYGDSVDLAQTPRGVFDETVWNTTSTLSHNPYSLSKTLAEKKAWEIANAQDRWRLVVCNPALVMGPGIKIHGSSESLKFMNQLTDGTLSMGAPDIRIGIVDVRDLAEAHVRAGFLPDAEGRHVLVGTDASMMAMADALREDWAHLPLPKRLLPKWLLWLVGPFAGFSRTFVSRNIGYPWKADTSKSIEKLGLTYRPLAATMGDFAGQLADDGRIPAPG